MFFFSNKSKFSLSNIIFNIIAFFSFFFSFNDLFAMEITEQVRGEIYCKSGIEIEIRDSFQDVYLKQLPAIGSPEVKLRSSDDYRILEIKNGHAKVQNYQQKGWLSLAKRVDYDHEGHVSLNKQCSKKLASENWYEEAVAEASKGSKFFYCERRGLNGFSDGDDYRISEQRSRCIYPAVEVSKKEFCSIQINKTKSSCLETNYVSAPSKKDLINITSDVESLRNSALCSIPMSYKCPNNQWIGILNKHEHLEVIDTYVSESLNKVTSLKVKSQRLGEGYVGVENVMYLNDDLHKEIVNINKSRENIFQANNIVKVTAYSDICKEPPNSYNSYTCKPLAQVTNGQKVHILERKFVNGNVKVKTSSGKIGFIDKVNIDLEKLGSFENTFFAPTKIQENAKVNFAENKTSNTNKDEKTKEIIIPKDITEISNDDKLGPIINCNQTEYRTIENFIKLNCQIKDDSEIYKVFVNGKEIKNNLSNFEFKIDNIPLDSSTYEIIAFDKMANQSQQIISVQRDFNYAYVDSENNLELLISGKIQHKNSSNRIALVIGIKSYQDIPNTQFGDKDAMVFVDFARENLNIKESNIKYLFNEDARFFEIKKLSQWLKSKINSKTEVFIFYSGHGANNEGESLILPSDFSPDLIADSSFTKKGFLNDMVNQYNPNHIYAFFDACFSGLGREGEQLIAGLRNITIAEEEVINDNISVFNSASGAEFSNDLSEAKHGLFSYYLMKGLEGEADSNTDRKITSNELFSFIQNNVSNKAIEIGRKQNPSYIGDSDRVILEW